MLDVWLFLDGNGFSMYLDYHCKSTYQTESDFTTATTLCRNDINCVMVSSMNCGDEDSEYELCNELELVPKLEACTYWKLGNKVRIKGLNQSTAQILVI